MNEVIYKYQLPIINPTLVWMPGDAKILHVDEQNGLLFVWAIVNTSNHFKNRKFFVRGTGQKIEDDMRGIQNSARYINTVQMSNGLVWHVFDGGEL